MPSLCFQSSKLIVYFSCLIAKSLAIWALCTEGKPCEQVCIGSNKVAYDNIFTDLSLTGDPYFIIYHNYTNHCYSMVLKDLLWNSNEKYKSFLISVIHGKIRPFRSFQIIRLPWSYRDIRTVQL